MTEMTGEQRRRRDRECGETEKAGEQRRRGNSDKPYKHGETRPIDSYHCTPYVVRSMLQELW